MSPKSWDFTHERRQRILAQMRQASDRGASLSRQLLAFARRQPLKPEPIDPRRKIDGMRELLDRTLRGDVLVRTDFAGDLWPIKVDPAELELVILNLCVNARDAMPNGGTITISANNAEASVRASWWETSFHCASRIAARECRRTCWPISSSLSSPPRRSARGKRPPHINVLRKPYEIHALDSALRVALATFAAS